MTSGRFQAEELPCFKRVPTPILSKPEIYRTPSGKVSVGLNERCLQVLSTPKSRSGCWNPKSNRNWISLTDTERLAPTVPPPPGGAWEYLLPGEEITSSVLDQIYPRSPGREDFGGSEDEFRDSRSRFFSRRTVMGNAKLGPQEITARLQQFRQTCLAKFATMKSAFDVFLNDLNRDKLNGSMTRELSFKEFSRFLNRHFIRLTPEEYEQIFEFLDVDKNGHISVSEFHCAIEAAAPVKNVEDMRRKLIALGHPSMRQALMTAMKNFRREISYMSIRLTIQEFGEALRKIGIHDEDEHLLIYRALTGTNFGDPIGTMSFDELSSGIAAVSPPLLLEDLRERMQKKYGSFDAAWEAMAKKANHCANQVYEGQWVQFMMSQIKTTESEALKLFSIVDINGNGSISRFELLAGWHACEPSLFFEDLRKKVRQRFRTIMEIVAMLKKDHEDRSDKENEIVIANYEEFDMVFQPLCLSQAEYQMLFELLNVHGNGHLRIEDIVKGIHLFAPCTCLEDVWLECLAKYGGVNEAFEGFSMESRSEVLDKDTFTGHLADLNLIADPDDKNVHNIWGLLEMRRYGGVSMAELIAALHCAAPGQKRPSSPEQRLARASKEVKWHMAGFRKTAQELRADVRQRHDPGRRRTPINDTTQLSQSQSAPTLPGMRQSQQKGKVSSPPRSPLKKEGCSFSHSPTKTSYHKMSTLLAPVPQFEKARITDKLHDYYTGAEKQLGADDCTLSEVHSRFGQWCEIGEHNRVLESKLSSNPVSPHGSPGKLRPLSDKRK